jgi:ATP-dependent DNA ligase
MELLCRNDKGFTSRYPSIAQALQNIPDETILDGELVAFDESGRPSFNRLQNYGSSNVPLSYYAFDLLILSGRDIRSEPLEKRRELLRTKILSPLKDPMRYSPTLDSSFSDLIQSVRQQRFEGLIAKRRNSIYESGQRTGAWLKMRVNRGQEFVIGGYTPSPKNFDALVLGYYESGKLIYVARTRNGFTPSLREKFVSTT